MRSEMEGAAVSPLLASSLAQKAARCLPTRAAFSSSATGEQNAAALIKPQRVAVALSGGRDSIALLHVMSALAQAHPNEIELYAFHVHHGLSPNADHWLSFCADTCKRLAVQFDAHRVKVERAGGESLEAVAREQRYTALGDICRQYAVTALLTAHHQDDQIETLLLQLVRGAGVDGLAAMGPQRNLKGVSLLRPWLDLPRSEIEAFARMHDIAWVDDESNDNPRFARNALRQWLPGLADVHPGYRSGIARAAAHLAEASELLEALAQSDLEQAIAPRGLALDHLESLPLARRKLVLRQWVQQRTGRPPSAAWIFEACTQLFGASIEAQVAVRLPGWVMYRYRGLAMLARERGEPPDQPMVGMWNGERRVHVAPWHGTLIFSPDPTGIPDSWLRQPQELRPRAAAERIAIAPGARRRALKLAWQDAGVAPWERPWMPLLWRGDTLLFVAGIGVNYRPLDELDVEAHKGESRWRLDWVPDPD
jgi:tRNA(Ile)-lysidine synthase